MKYRHLPNRGGWNPLTSWRKGRQRSRRSKMAKPKPGKKFTQNVEEVIANLKGNRVFLDERADVHTSAPNRTAFFQLGTYDRTNIDSFNTISGINNQAKVRYSSWKDSCLINNATNGVIRMDRWAIYPRHNLGEDEIPFHNQNSLYNALGAADALGANHNRTSATLFCSGSWTRMFRIGKHKTFKIPVGESIRQTLYQPWPIINTIITPGNAGNAKRPVLYKGSKFYFYRITGPVVYENIPGESFDVSYGVAKVGVVYDNVVFYDIMGSEAAVEQTYQTFTDLRATIGNPALFEIDGSLKTAMYTSTTPASAAPGD